MQLQENVNERVKMIVVSIALLAGLIPCGCSSQQAAPKPGFPEVAVVTVNP